MTGPTPMVPQTSAPALAHAFLALADDAADADQRTLPRVVAAAAASVVLALAVPLGWAAFKPSDHPLGAIAPPKSALTADEE